MGSRREFIKQAAGAAIAAPYFLTSEALGAAGKPAASERVLVGQVGIGDAEAAKWLRRPYRAPWTL